MSLPIIQFFMTLRNGSKNYHWNTTSYARHKASDQFVENMDKLIDRFVEVYIGKHGRPAGLGKDMALTLPGTTEKSIIAFLLSACDWLTNSLPKMIKPKDTDLLNIRDEMLAEINQTLYLFTQK
jgi:hypothetical protein